MIGVYSTPGCVTWFLAYICIQLEYYLYVRTGLLPPERPINQCTLRIGSAQTTIVEVVSYPISSEYYASGGTSRCAERARVLWYVHGMRGFFSIFFFSSLRNMVMDVDKDEIKLVAQQG